MEMVTGIFSSRDAADAAARDLREHGWSTDRTQVLYPTSSRADEAGVPIEDTEQPGVAKAVGGVVGGAAGLSLGAIVAGLAVPGVGPAIGAATAALMGAGGAIGGAAAADAFEENSVKGLPHDELYLYEDALAHGKSVLFAEAKSPEAAESARRALADAGAESLDAARETWWIGLRDAEKDHYESLGNGDWTTAEDAYRRGFTAAQHPSLRGKAWDEASGLLRKKHGKLVDVRAFVAGYERGRRIRERTQLVGATPAPRILTSLPASPERSGRRRSSRRRARPV